MAEPHLVLEVASAAVTQEGQRRSEDAWVVRRGNPTVAALADGAGRAEGVARRILVQLERGIADWDDESYRLFPSWSGLFRTLDSAFLGGAQAALLAVAVLEDRVLGAAAGDCRLLVRRRDGRLEILTDRPSRFRIGSGRVEPAPIHAPFGPGEMLVLLTDGAWTPFSLTRLQELLARRALGPLPDLAEAVIAEASRTGRADDATVVVLRRRS